MPKKLRLGPKSPRPVKLGSIEKVEDSMDRLAKSIGHETTFHSDMEQRLFGHAKTTYFYVWGVTKEGKRVILGPKMSMQEADELLATLDDGEIVESTTRDLTRATREIKAIMIERGAKPDRALERIGHQK